MFNDMSTLVGHFVSKKHKKTEEIVHTETTKEKENDKLLHLIWIYTV